MSDVDRLLNRSAAKTIALVEVVGCEYDARGDGLRALVLVDAEQAPAAPNESLTGVLRPATGTAPEVLLALADDGRTRGLRPLLVTGRGLRCAEHDAADLLAALQEEARRDAEGWRAEPDGTRVVRLSATGASWQPRLWVELATAILTGGSTQVLVGTRALLGEGWDAPAVNCLVDLTAATTSVSVTQMRGRSLRLDAAHPEKIASNWDVVCVAPELARGSADYERFVRKHLHVFAPTEDGAIEAGPSHVHPALGPFAPPPGDQLDEINRTMTRRAAAHEQARERWRIGVPYVSEERQTLVLRPRRPADVEPPRAAPPGYPLRQRIPLAVAAAGAVVAPAAAVAEPRATVGAAVVPAALAWAARRLARMRRELSEPLPLDLAARAICDAYVELGELSPAAAGSLAIEPRASAYLRCFLGAATTDESERFVRALDAAASPVAAPRYLVSRLVPAPARGRLSLLGRVLVRRPPFERRWVAVPDDFGRNKERAEAFVCAWERWIGPTELVFTQRSAQGREALAEAQAQAEEYETSARRVWV